jgi:hypothetical protein
MYGGGYKECIQILEREHGIDLTWKNKKEIEVYH